MPSPDAYSYLAEPGRRAGALSRRPQPRQPGDRSSTGPASASRSNTEPILRAAPHCSPWAATAIRGSSTTSWPEPRRTSRASPLLPIILSGFDVAFCPVRSRKGYVPVTLAQRPGRDLPDLAAVVDRGPAQPDLRQRGPALLARRQRGPGRVGANAGAVAAAPDRLRMVVRLAALHARRARLARHLSPASEPAGRPGY